MHLKILEINALKYMSLILLIFICTRICMASLKLELFTNPNTLLMIEEGIRGGITQISHGYAEANNKCMKNYDKNEESLFLMFLDANNLYGCPMTEKLPVGNFKWVKSTSKIDEVFTKTYDKNDDIGYFLKVDIEYPEELHDLHIDLPFVPEKNGN